MLDSSALNKKIRELNKEMTECEGEVYDIYCRLRAREGRQQKPSLQSMKTTIGSKNNIYADCINNEFPSPDAFYAKWLKGLIDHCGTNIHNGTDGPCRDILIEMLKYDICKRYIKIFLERNYYRNYKPRKRYKPEAELWEVWFGENPLYWGIMISPAYRNGKWTSDVSEIRRTDYEYWTIGHILSTGIVTPDNPTPFIFDNLGSFITFYEHIFLRLSNSKYEQQIMERYLSYVQNSDNPYVIPLLIPEFRFYKNENEHIYRLDFTILNPYTRQRIGFELSPQSTHMSISGISSGKTQKQFNVELKTKWEKEMSKRNEYFAKYGITIITFTDTMLHNMEGCFSIVAEYLEKRNRSDIDLTEQEERLKSILNSELLL